MDIFSFEFENWHSILLRVNWIAIIILIALIVVVSLIIKKLIPILNKKSIIIDEVELGIGNSKVAIKFEQKDREIAYKLWIEMSTRKITIPFDEQNDVIIEVYNSWYNFFNIARELIKTIPADRIQHSKELIILTERVLNEGLRPHLTKWQAKFRHWYNEEIKKQNNKTPQKVQQGYKDYALVIEDIKKTNEILINYNNLMKKIAFNE